jgi:methylmalonyl-CoA/ethylmalonyl-CoA epimerase
MILPVAHNLSQEPSSETLLPGVHTLGLSHLGLAVANIDDVRATYQAAFGATFEGAEIVVEQRVRVAFLRLGVGPAAFRLELLEPTDDDSPLARFLAKRGPGVHHVAYEVLDVAEALAAARAAGLELIDQCPRRGAHGAEIAFLHPKSTGGLLIELCRSETVGNAHVLPKTTGVPSGVASEAV